MFVSPANQPVHKTASRRSLLAVVSLVAALLTVAIFHAQKADAAPVAPFTSVFHTQDNGQIGFFGNTIMSCPTAATGCAAARNAVGTTSAQNNINNNDFNMTYVNADTNAGLTNSSSSTVVLPNQATVLFAGLYWGGRTTAGSGGAVAPTGLTKNTMKLRVPGSASYVTETSTSTVDAGDGTTYSSYVNVTSTVQQYGAGMYFGGDVDAATGADRFGGWSLIVAYRSPSLPLRDLTIFNGYEYIAANSAGDSFNFSGFLTPPSGTVRSRIGVLSWEGDAGFVGDSMTLNSTALSSSISPASNFFDATNDLLGANVTTRNPTYQNMMGMDIKDIAAPDALPNNARSATVSLKTNGDAYYPQAIATTVDLYAPNFSSLVKTVKDLSGNSPAAAGDVLQYTLSFTNSGDDAATNSVVNDPLPAGLTYVPNSLTVSNAGAAAVRVSDATGDDTGEFANGTVVARVGTGASATAGGTLAAQQNAPNNTATITFQARINRNASGSTINNTGSLNYTAQTINQNYTFVGNTVSTPVAALADLAVTGTASPTPVAAGNQVTYNFTVANTTDPHNDAAGVVLTTTIPSSLTGVTATYGNGTPCDVSGGTVTCQLGTVAHDTSVPVTIVGTVPSGAATGSLAATATVSATTADDVNSNNIATVSTNVSQSADLAVTHTQAAPTVVPGRNATYTITVTNNGPSDAASTTITDTLPSGLTFLSASGNGLTCSEQNGIITCPAGTLASGATRTITVVATVDSTATAGTTYQPTAAATTTTPDPRSANNSASVTTTAAAPSADVSISVNPTPNPAVPGTNEQLGYTVTNNGPSTATGITATIPIPAGTTFLGISSRTGSCSYVAGDANATCTLGSLSSGATTAILLQTTVASGRTTTITSTATVDAPADTATANNSATLSLPVSPLADIDVNVVGDQAQLAAGDIETYTITVTNNGPSDAANVVVSNPIPDNTTFVDASNGYDTATNTWSLGTVAVGAPVTLTLRVRATASTTADTAIVDTATGRTTTTESSTTNNVGQFRSTTDTVADLSVTGSAPATVTAGSQTTLTFPVANTGPSDAADSSFTYTLPNGVTLASGQDSNATACTQTGSTVTCSLGTLPADPSGATVDTVTLNLNVGPGVPPGPLSTTASVSSSTQDPTASNNATTVVLRVVTAADLGVTQSIAPGTTPAGSSTPVTDTVVVTNYGPSAAASTRLKLTPPVGLTFGTFTPPTGVTCTTPGGVLTCVLNSVNPGAGNAITLSIPVTADASTAAGTYTLAARVSTTTTEPDPDTLHADGANASVQVTTLSDVTVTQSAGPDPVVPGQTANQTVTVANAGPSDAQNTVVTITGPTGARVSGATTAQGSCTVTTGTNNDVIVCTVGPVAAGESLPIMLTYAVAASTRTSLTFQASATTDTAESNSNNNSATPVTISVAPSADIAVVQTVDAPYDAATNTYSVVAGSGTTYSFTVSNRGPSDATNVVLSGTLPAGVTPLGLNAPQGVTCDRSALPRISCSIATLPTGTSLTGSLDIVVSASATDGQRITNTATVTQDSGTTDPVSTNNSSSTTIVVSTQAQLVIRQQANPSTSVVPGADYIYRLAVGNNGPSDARDVVLTDNLPAGVIASSVSFTQNGQDVACTIGNGGNSFSCALGTVGSGVVVVTAAGVRLDAASTATSVTNNASATTSTAAPAGGSQTVTSALTNRVTPSASVTLTKTAMNGTVTAGGTVTWTITAFNDGGPSVAANYVITDALIGDPDYMPANPETGAAAIIPADMPVFSNITATSPNGTCTQTANPDRYTDVSCSLGTLAVNGSATVTITANVSSAYAKANLTNTAHQSSTAFLNNGVDSNTSTVAVTQSVDRRVSVTPVTNPITPGSAASYQVSVTNTGLSDTPASSVTIPVPASFGAVTVTDGAGNAVACNGTPLVCPIGALTAGTSATLTVSGTVDPAATGTATEAASIPADDDASNNTASTSVTITPVADLSVAKAVDPSTPVAGSPATYTITVANAGPSVAHDVTVADMLQNGQTPGTATGGTCTTTGQQVSCTIATIAAHGSAQITIPVQVASSFNGAQFSNTATASSADDTNTDNNTVTIFGPSATSADVTSAVTVTPEDPGPGTVATPGTAVTYAVTVGNSGPSDATAPSSVITLSPGQSLSSVNPPAGWTCTTPVVAGNGSTTLTCSTTGTLTAHTSASIQVVAAVAASSTGTVGLTAANSATTSDPDTTNNARSASVTLAPRANLEVHKSISPTRPVAGQDATYTVTIQNHGPSDAHTVALSDTIQTGVTVLGTPTVMGAAGSCTVTGQEISCTIPDLAPTPTPDLAAVVTIPVHFAPSFDPAMFSNTAPVTSPDDSDTTDNTGTISGPGAESADLSTTVSAAPQAPGSGTGTTAVAVPGKQVTYTVTAHNAGPSDAQTPTVTITLPNGETLSGSVNAPAGWTCTGTTTITCTAPSFAFGPDAVFTLVTDVDPGATASQTLTASTTSAVAADPTPGNNQGSATVTLMPQADLDVSKSIDPNPPTAGEDATYTVTILNHGPSFAHSVAMSDTLQAGVSVRDAVTIAGAVGSCTVNGQTISCTIATLAVTTATVSIPVHFAASFDPAHFANSAPVSSPDDLITSNNTGAVGGAGAASADLSTSVVTTPQAPGSGTTAVPGKQVSYQVTVHNAGPSDAASPTVVFTLPNGQTLSRITPPSGWTCSGTTTITCQATSLAADADAVFTVVTDIDPSATGSQTLTAVASAPTDQTAGNNGASSTVTLDPRADLQVSKTVSPAVPVAGATATYTVTVTNAGPSTATGITVTDAVQDGQTVQGTPSIEGGSCSVDGQNVSCTVASLAAGSASHLSITVQLAANFDPTSFTNSATATATTGDPDPTNNVGAVSGPAAAQADLQVSKKAASPVVAGGRVTWTVTVHNAGPSVATSVAITDPVPSDATVQSAELTGDGTGASCTAAATVQCTLDTLAAGDTAVVTIVATLASGASGTLTNTATATAADQQDTDTSDNVATVSSPITQAATIKLTKTASPSVLTADTDETYTITATDTGTSDAIGVVLTDPLADGLEFRSVSTDPTGASCDTSDGVSCTFPRVAAGQTVRMIVVVHVADGFGGSTLTNTATATSPSLPVAKPPTTTVTSPVRSGNGIAVSKTVNQPAAAVGAQVVFIVGVANHGSAAVHPVVVDDRPPAGMTIVSVSASGGSYSPSAGRWTLSSLGANGHATLRMVVRLGRTGSMTNVASVDPSTPGTETGSARATASVDAEAPANGSGNGNGLAYTGVAVLQDVIWSLVLLGLGIGLIIVAGRRSYRRRQ